MFGLNKTELAVLKKLNTPIKIQNYLDTLPINWEKTGETYLSPRQVLRRQTAHCFEGALLAAAALWLGGEPPLLLDLTAYPFDDDHVVALYRRGGRWGAISKTNHATLRFRDPIYRTVRELAVSYFHEYFLDKNGRKVLQSYSRSFDLRRFGADWVATEADLRWLMEALDRSRHYRLVPKKIQKFIRPADKMERRAGRLLEWPQI